MEIREIQPTIIVAPAFKNVAAYARVSVEKQAALDSLSNCGAPLVKDIFDLHRF